MEETKACNERPLAFTDEPLAFTVELLRVQAGQYNDRLGHKLKAAIAAWQQATPSATAYAVARRLWLAWAEDEAVPAVLDLPPLYESTDVQSIVKAHVANLLSAESGTKPECTAANTIVTGVVGVGKTILLKVCSMLHALRSPKHVVVYWDYGATPVRDELSRYGDGTSYFPADPCEALHHVIGWAAGDRLADPGSPQHAFGETFADQHETLAGVYCDEIGNFYTPNSTPERKKEAWGRVCAKNLCSLGKASHCIVMCTGSATQLPSMIFPARAGPFSSYPALRFVLETVRPVRSRAAVADFVKARYGLVLTEGAARDLFRATGGVGRRIHDWHTSHQDLEAVRRLAVAPTQAALEDRNHPLHESVLTFAGKLYSRYGDSSERNGDALLGVPCSKILKDLTCDDLARLQDEHIVFDNSEAFMHEFLAPACFDVVVDFFQHDAAARALNDMHACFSGWAGRGTDGSARVVAEALVLRHLLPHDRAPVRLETRDGAVYTHCGDTCTLLRDVSISELCSRAVRVDKSTGASAFVITAKSARVYEVHGVTIHLGDHTLGFTAGVLEAQRSKGSNAGRDKSCIAGVVACLEVAWRAFRAVLHEAYPRKTFRLTGASLLSNKEVVHAAQLSAPHLRVRTGERALLVGPRVACPLTLVCGTGFFTSFAWTSFAECCRVGAPSTCYRA